jgi:hypothetical protein
MSRCIPALPNDLAIVLCTKPRKTLDNGVDCGLVVALGIGIFDAQLELPTMTLCIKVAEESRTGTSDMQVSSG